MRQAVRDHRQFDRKHAARLENAAVSVPFWMCCGKRLEEQEGAARAALCEAHLQHRVRVIMGLAP